MGPSLRDVSSGVYGAWRLARLDRAAMAWFDRTADGVWRSFWAAAIAYPGFVLLQLLRVEPAVWATAGEARVVIIESIGYVVSWTVFLLAVLPFCRWLERDEQSLGFVIAYNWSQVLQTALMVATVAVGKLMPPEAATLLDLAALIALLLYEWFIARLALDAGGVAASAVVLLDLVITTAVGKVAESLY
jgi:hypothetical protein